jgi:hypothetical protein
MSQELVLMKIRIGLVIIVMMLGAALSECVPSSGGNLPSINTVTAAHAKSALKITDFGPKQIQAGVPFHKQPDGSAATWLRVNYVMTGSNISVYFDGTPLKPVIKGNLVTAQVPSSLYANAGAHTLRIAGSNYGGVKISSNTVKMMAR